MSFSFKANNIWIKDENKKTMFSSLCKNNLEYYSLTIADFLTKCHDYNCKDAMFYIYRY